MAGNKDNVKDAGGLLQKADEINAAAERFQAELDSLDKLITSFTDVWEGDVKDAFDQAYYGKYQKYIKEVIESLKNYHTEAKTTAQKAADRISEGTGRFNSL